MRDPKNSFYKYLNLDEENATILKWYRKISKDLFNDKYDKTIDLKDKEDE